MVKKKQNFRINCVENRCRHFKLIHKYKSIPVNKIKFEKIQKSVFNC